MTTAEKIYRTMQKLPEPMLHEVLDFAEFLKQKKSTGTSKSGNLAKHIQEHFKGLNAEDVIIPSRQFSSTLPQVED
ncbi:MAG: DUF2281 domain-containing protein [Chlorobium sp.]